MHLIFTLLQTTAQKVRHIGSGCSLHKQWGKYSTTTTGYDDISYPIAFTDAVFSVIPVDWDTSNITVSRGYTFTVLENDTTLSKCRITSGTGGAGLIRVAFIGR